MKVVSFNDSIRPIHSERLTAMATEVVHDHAEQRYVISLDDQPAGSLSYQINGDKIEFVSTFVNPALRGKNLAAIVTKHALDEVRAEGKYKVVPVCSYTVKYFEMHPDEKDLLA